MTEGAHETSWRAALDERLASCPGARVSVVARGARRLLAYRSECAYHAASTMKLGVLAEVLRQVAAGTLRWDERLLVVNRFVSAATGAPYRVAEDSDPDLYDRLGERVRVDALTARTIRRSSNLAANLLLDRVTVASTRRTLARLGVDPALVRRGVEDLEAHRAGLNNMTTAADLALLLEAWRCGKAVSEEADRQAIRLLMGQTDRRMIPRGLPKGVPVAHKTGWTSVVFHDAAIVDPEGASPYVLVVCTEGFPGREAAARFGTWVAGSVHRLMSP